MFINWKLVLLWGGEAPKLELNALFSSQGSLPIRILCIWLASRDGRCVDSCAKIFPLNEKTAFELLEFENLKYSFLNTNLLNEIDAVYIGWGNAIRLMRELKKYNLFPIILNLLQNGKVVIGKSAGATIFFRKFLTSIDRLSDWKMTYVPKVYNWFGLIDALISAHFTQWDRQVPFQHFCDLHKIVWVGIDEGAALCIEKATLEYWTTCPSSHVWWYNPKNKEMTKSNLWQTKISLCLW